MLCYIIRKLFKVCGDFEDVKGNKYQGFARPIGQWNCRHVKFPIVIGVSEPVYTEEQLKEFAENSKQKYELTQKQRAMETKLRRLKTERIAASAAGDELEAKRIQRKINEQQTIYRRFSEKNNLLYDTKRASVEGYRRISSKIPIAAHSAERNTGKTLNYNSKADFNVKLDSFNSDVNIGISKASQKVAELGGKTAKEYVSLVDLVSGKECFFESGTFDSVGSQEFWDFIGKNKEKTFAFIHNHNTDGCFSETDMRTLLTTKNIKVFGAIRIDGVKYFAEKIIDLKNTYNFDPIFEKEINDLNYKYKCGKITAGERTHLREEIIVNGLLEKYTKGLIELDGRK
ncbi:MAG: phage minor capsid protein [Acutalibacteraceae bacterium]